MSTTVQLLYYYCTTTVEKRDKISESSMWWDEKSRVYYAEECKFLSCFLKGFVTRFFHTYTEEIVIYNLYIIEMYCVYYV